MGPSDAAEQITPGWRFVAIGFEADPVEVGGIDIWRASWTSTDGRITVAHPSHPWQRHTMFTYLIAGSVPPIEFAAGEFSNGVWGVFARDARRSGA